MDAWSGATSSSWCTTSVCEGSAAEIAARLEPYGAGRARFSVPGATLALDAPTPTAGVVAVSPRRVHPARLRYARWRRAARVTVEVGPWTATCAEVLIRPSRRRPRDVDTYLAAALALVHAVVGELAPDRGAPVSAPAFDAPLRRVS